MPTDHAEPLTKDAFLAALSDIWSQPAPPPNTLYISKDTADRIRQAGRFWDIVQAIFGTKRPIPRDKWNKVRWPKQFGNTSWEYRCGPETTN